MSVLFRLGINIISGGEGKGRRLFAESNEKDREEGERESILRISPDFQSQSREERQAGTREEEGQGERGKGRGRGERGGEER